MSNEPLLIKVKEIKCNVQSVKCSWIRISRDAQSKG